MFKTGFSVHNNHLYLCLKVKDTKWILCCRKIGVKCAYLRFLMYKECLNVIFNSLRGGLLKVSFRVEHLYFEVLKIKLLSSKDFRMSNFLL